MQQYGLDGVLVQRFVTDIPANRAGGDIVLQNVMAAAARYGRVFAIEYDISGANAATLASGLQQDWKYLVDTLGVTSNPAYLYHNGKPVVSVWGIGLNDASHPPSDPDAALQLVQGFQTQAQVTYLGGTPAYWRTLSNDAAADSRWTAVYQAMDGIQPWTVGRYATVPDVDRWKTNRLEPDVAATSQRQQLYMPVIFPGFSWHNLNRTAPENQIPRSRGQFLWQQAYNAWTAGAQMLKIAMFDEVNESTAMFKLASRRQDAPDQGYWLTLDADGATLPSDWYLRLAGEITRVFHGQSKAVASMPSNPGPPWAGTSPLSVQNGASFAAGAAGSGSDRHYLCDWGSPAGRRHTHDHRQQRRWADGAVALRVLSANGFRGAGGHSAWSGDTGGSGLRWQASLRQRRHRSSGAGDLQRRGGRSGAGIWQCARRAS